MRPRCRRAPAIRPLAAALAAALLASPAAAPPAAARPSEPDPAAPRTEAGELPRLQARDGERLVDLPLQHTRVEGAITGFVARMEVTQTFANPFEVPIEAIYVFPLPDNAAVDDMRIAIGRRVIEGRIERRADARKAYERAKRAGHTAALLEQERPNVFTQSIANLAPGETIEVVIRYVQDLSYDEGTYELVFPMVVGPRYHPGAPRADRSGAGTAPDTAEVPDASRVSPPLLPPGTRSGHDVSLTLTLDPALPVVDVETPTHDVDLAERDGAMTVTLAPHDAVPDRDFVLRYRVDGPALQAAVTAHRTGRDGYLALVLQPPTLDVEALVGRRELVFVVDVSGSMSGVPLALCKEAMREALGRLRPGDTFNVLTFAGATRRLYPRPVAATAAHVREALELVDAAQAGGGTEMADAVEAALAPDGAPDRHRYVFFLTDGYVGNEDAILARTDAFVTALDAAGRVGRVFGFGVGSSVNRHLLDGLGRAGRGATLVATNREDPVRGVDRFFRLIDHPVLTDVRIDWGGLAVRDVTPAVLPDLFASRPLVVHARYRRGGQATVTLSGRAGDREVRLPVAVTLPDREPRHAVLGTLWARARVQALEADLWHGYDERVVEAITRLGLAHRLLTGWTSFVAVDTSRKVGHGQPWSIVQPVEEPEDVDGAMAGGGFATGSGGGGYGVGRGSMALAAPRPMVFSQSAAGSASVQGSLDATVVRRIIARRQAAVRALYEKALKGSPSLSGRILLRITLAPSGEVLAVEALEDTVGNEAFTKALLRVVRGWRFPSSATGGTTQFTFPFVFRTDP